MAKTLQRPATRGGVVDFKASSLNCFDGVAQAVRLLVQEGAGARGAHGVHGEILDDQVAVLLRHHDHLGVFAPHVDDGAGLGGKMMGAPALGNDFIDELAA